MTEDRMSLYQTQEYRDYIASPAWQQKRRSILAAANYRCQECGAQATDVHHVTYERLGNEQPSDLRALCRPCHDIADARRINAREADHYGRRLDAWATKKYGEDWADYRDPVAVEEAFDEWLDRQDDGW